MRRSARPDIGFENRDPVHEPLVAVEREIELLLLSRDDVADLSDSALEVSQLFLDDFESLEHGRECALLPSVAHQRKAPPKRGFPDT